MRRAHQAVMRGSNFGVAGARLQPKDLIGLFRRHPAGTAPWRWLAGPCPLLLVPAGSLAHAICAPALIDQGTKQGQRAESDPTATGQDQQQCEADATER